MSHDQSNISPYRKVSTATWSDRKVLNLSPLKPSGQALFLMLMAGPQTTNIPGVQPVGRMAFAEMLGWDLEAFDEAFAEALREGLAKADWKARLIFVPNAIKHNPPQSINVVKSWAHMWSRVPECELKTEAWNTISEALSEQGENFVRAFKSACPLEFAGSNESFEEASENASNKPTDKATGIQEAVSSKQELNTPQPPKGGGRGLSEFVPDGFARFWAVWPTHKRKGSKSKCLKVWCRKSLERNTDSIIAHVELCKASQDWRKQGGEFIPAPLVYLNGERWDGVGDDSGASSTDGDYWRAAGFPNIWEAQNAECWPHTAHRFRDGRRVSEEVAV